MNQKRKNLTIKLDLKIYNLDLGVKKSWVITLIVCLVQIAAWYLKSHGP